MNRGCFTNHSQLCGSMIGGVYKEHLKYNHVLTEETVLVYEAETKFAAP